MRGRMLVSFWFRDSIVGMIEVVCANMVFFVRYMDAVGTGVCDS